MSKFEYLITSSMDREKLSCEIYYGGEILGEISQETSEFLLEIYPSKDQQWWKIPLHEFEEAICCAKKHLIGQI